jgi:deazaflavin-dependent oxidoreductase (nitroreductase family)
MAAVASGAMDYLRVADRIWPLLNRLAKGHTALYRLTRGRIGHRPPGLPQMLLLDHVGARTGTLRTTPLAYARDGDDYVLVASKGGFPRNPAWFHGKRRARIPTRRSRSAAAGSPSARASRRPRSTSGCGPRACASTRASRPTARGPAARSRSCC